MSYVNKFAKHKIGQSNATINYLGENNLKVVFSFLEEEEEEEKEEAEQDEQDEQDEEARGGAGDNSLLPAAPQ